jgi:uncharacterized protein
MAVLKALMDKWIGRRAPRNPEANASVEGRTPFTIITGGSEGIGKAFAEASLKRGDAVLLVARDNTLLQETQKELEATTNGRCHTLALDITQTDAGGQIDSAVAAADGYVDLLINNAGIGASGDFVRQCPDQLKKMINLNMAASTILMRHVLPGMCDRGRGGIINVASLGAAVPGPYQAAYYASKSYLVSLTEAVTHEIRGQGVRLLAVLPGPVETAFHARMGANEALYRTLLPSLTPAFVARSALAAFDRGQTIAVPGTPGALISYALRLLPHPIAVPIVGWLLRQR